MKKKVMNVVKVALGNLVLVSLLSGCGNVVDLDVPERMSQEVVESAIAAESETSVTEKEEETTNNAEDVSEEAATEVITESESDVRTETIDETAGDTTSELIAEAENETAPEIIVAPENESKTESNLTVIVNGASLSMEAREYEEKYIIYEDMEPTTMYAIRYSEMYPDLNASEGVLRMDGCVFVGDEVTIDGKGTYEGVEYYRIKRPKNCFNPYSSILPADALSLEKPVQQSAVEQTVESSIMVAAAPAEENISVEDLMGTDMYANLSEEDKRELERMLNYDGQIRWAEDPNADIPGYSCERNENGGFTIIDPTIPPEILEKMGRLIVY